MEGRNSWRRGLGVDGIANLDDAGLEDVGAESASVDHWSQQSGAGETLQVRTGLAEPPTDAAGSSDLELLAYERVEIDAACDDVSARIRKRQI
jgi:hypothetical protein